MSRKAPTSSLHSSQRLHKVQTSVEKHNRPSLRALQEKAPVNMFATDSTKNKYGINKLHTPMLQNEVNSAECSQHKIICSRKKKSSESLNKSTMQFKENPIIIIDDDDAVPSEMDSKNVTSNKLQEHSSLLVPKFKLTYRSVEMPKNVVKEKQNEEKLHSGDDISDSEDNTLDCENTVYCVFDKVVRKKNKWKVYFKNGFANINNKEIAFSKMVGELTF